MIKKIYILLLTVLGMGVISSCSDYLNSEKYFKDRLTLEKTFESKDHMMRILIMLGHGGHVIKEFSKHQYLSIMLTGVKRWLIGKY